MNTLLLGSPFSFISEELTAELWLIQTAVLNVVQDTETVPTVSLDVHKVLVGEAVSSDVPQSVLETAVQGTSKTLSYALKTRTLNKTEL